MMLEWFKYSSNKLYKNKIKYEQDKLGEYYVTKVVEVRKIELIEHNHLPLNHEKG